MKTQTGYITGPFIIVKAVSTCKTYKETFKCLSHAEADALIKALVAEGWVATKQGA